MATANAPKEETSNETTELSEEDKEFYLNIKPQSDYDLSIFMVGITGAGKSSFCNFLCNKEVFEEAGGMMSVSQIVSLCRFKYDSKEVLILDSPGFCDSIRSDDEIFDEICRVGVIAKDGTDAIALVVNANERFSDNHRKALSIMESMGGSFWEHTFIVFTKECDLLRNKANSGEEYLKNVTQNPKCPPVLTEMLKMTENRYMFVDSIKYFQNDEYRNEKCIKMIKLITEIRKKNNDQRYNNTLMKQGKKLFCELERSKKKEEKLRQKLKEERKANREMAQRKTEGLSLREQMELEYKLKAEMLEKEKALEIKLAVLQTEVRMEREMHVKFYKEEVKTEAKRQSWTDWFWSGLGYNT